LALPIFTGLFLEHCGETGGSKLPQLKLLLERKRKSKKRKDNI
jgi:hypothetical protein